MKKTKENQQEKVNKTKYSFFQKASKIGKALGDRPEKADKISNIRNEYGDTTTDSSDIKKIWEHSQQVYTNISHNLNKMNKLFKRHKVSKFTQEKNR